MSPKQAPPPTMTWIDWVFVAFGFGFGANLGVRFWILVLGAL